MNGEKDARKTNKIGGNIVIGRVTLMDSNGGRKNYWYMRLDRTKKQGLNMNRLSIAKRLHRVGIYGDNVMEFSLQLSKGTYKVNIFGRLGIENVKSLVPPRINKVLSHLWMCDKNYDISKVLLIRIKDFLMYVMAYNIYYRQKEQGSTYKQFKIAKCELRKQKTIYQS